MTHIFEYIDQHKNEIAYIVRSAMGNWNISLVRKGNVTGRSISSYQELKDHELETIKSMGILTYDFESAPDFRALCREVEKKSYELCY